jgi:hypothetical protein
MANDEPIGLPDGPAPTNVRATNIQSNQVTIAWDAVTSSQEFRINYGVTVISNISGLNYTVTGLTDSTSYTFTVQVKVDDEWSRYSSPINITTGTGSGSVDIPDAGSGDSGVDALGSFIFMTGYDIPSGATGTVTLTYRIGSMLGGLLEPVITKTVTKESLISNFGLNPSLEGIKIYNPKEYGL